MSSFWLFWSRASFAFLRSITFLVALARATSRFAAAGTSKSIPRVISARIWSLLRALWARIRIWKNMSWRLVLISLTLLTARRVCCITSRLYRTGLFLLFSNSKVESTVSSLLACLRKALVHLTFLGLRFLMKFRWHFDRQKVNTCKWKWKVKNEKWVNRSVNKSERHERKTDGMKGNELELKAWK